MRLRFDIPPEPHQTMAELLAVSAYRLAYLLTLCGAVTIVYVIARAVFG